MYRSVYDFRAFYNSKIGRIVRRVLLRRLQLLWPNVNGLRLLGVGYSTPYLGVFEKNAERIVSLSPKSQGAYHWPSEAGEKNKVFVSEDCILPIENSSIDRVILIHHLEHCEFIKSSLEEIWRVLKPSGRLLVVVPNRNSFWAHADWSPFGKGTPYSSAQLNFYLQDNGFIHEKTEEALFFPPAKKGVFLKSTGLIEWIGRQFLPFIGGVHIVEVSKQVFANIDRGASSKAKKVNTGFVAKPAPSNFKG